MIKLKRLSLRARRRQGGGGGNTVSGAPTIGVATAGNGTISVVFTAPASNGGSAITSYTATLSTGETQSGSSSPINFTGLTNGVARTATVTATNGVGTSSASAASNSVTPAAVVTVPTAPTIGVATAGDGTVTVTFTAPSSNGGSAITNYTATLSTGATQSAIGSPIVFTGVTNDVAVTVTVKANNAIGASPASAASNSVTPAIPIRAVTAQNRINNATDTGGSTVTGTGGATANSPRLGWVRRWHHVIGSGAVDKIRFAYDNWYGNASSNTVSDIGNAHTITAGSVEFNGVIVPILFGGNRSITIADGAGHVLSDWIYPSQFSVSQFNRGDTFWTKENGTVPAVGNKMPDTARYNQDLTGCQMGWYAPDQTTISSVDATGLYTATGVAFLSRTSGACPIVLGTFIGGDKPVRMIKGDSIAEAQGQTVGFKLGRGYCQRAQVDADGTSNPFASINFAVYGSQATLAVSDPRIKAYDKHANSQLIEYGTNDFSIVTTLTTAQMFTRIDAIIAASQAEGITRFAVQKLGVRTDSTDNWFTEANQTPRAGWETGGRVDSYNTALDSKGYQLIVPNNAIRGTDPSKWLSNGTAKYTQDDNVHPSTNGHNLKAAELRPYLATLDAL